MFKFSPNSRKHLDTCHPDIIKVIEAAIRYYDFSVVCGHRGKEAQDAAVAGGFSKTPWPTSMHNKVPSLAVDCYPFHQKYGSLVDADSVIDKIAKMNNLDNRHIVIRERITGFIRQEYCRMGQTILMCAKDLGVEIIWGRDWDRDNDIFDHNFIDYPHFELKLN